MNGNTVLSHSSDQKMRIMPLTVAKIIQKFDIMILVSVDDVPSAAKNIWI